MKHMTHKVSSPDRSIGPHTCNDRLDDLVWTARLVRPIVTFLVCGEIVRMDKLMGFSSAIVQPILSNIGLTMKLTVWGEVGWPSQDGVVFFDLPCELDQPCSVQGPGWVDIEVPLLRWPVWSDDRSLNVWRRYGFWSLTVQNKDRYVCGGP